jgi:hypothetical protein
LAARAPQRHGLLKVLDRCPSPPEVKILLVSDFEKPWWEL